MGITRGIPVGTASMTKRAHVRDKIEEGAAPAPVTSLCILSYVRGMTKRFRAHMPVLSQSEMHRGQS
jgi:hypothetical protein